MIKKAIALYVRVSTSKQDLKSQEPDLRTWLKANRKRRPVLWYSDKFTGRTLKRPGMQKLERDLHGGKVGTVVVWRLDRLGRTVVELLQFLEELDAGGVEFVSVRDAIDTRTAAGRLLRVILAGFAAYENEIRSERVKAGIKRARTQGKEWGGRQEGTATKLTPKVLRSIRALLREDTSKSEIARQLGMSRDTLYRGIELLEGS